MSNPFKKAGAQGEAAVQAAEALCRPGENPGNFQPKGWKTCIAAHFLRILYFVSKKTPWEELDR